MPLLILIVLLVSVRNANYNDGYDTPDLRQFELKIMHLPSQFFISSITGQ
jgi:hypothetical protein